MTHSLGSLVAPVALATAGILAVAGAAGAGQIWTDLDGDGLPGDVVFGEPSDQVLVDVWLDSQSFEWTQFQVAVDVGDADYVAPGAVLPPCAPTFASMPGLVIVTGSGCGLQHGVQKVAAFTIHLNSCVTCPLPLIQDGEIAGGSATCAGDVSRLVNGPTVLCFTTAGGDCARCDAPTASESRTWGEVKGLYR